MIRNYVENIFKAIKVCQTGQTIWQGKNPSEDLDTEN